MGRQAWRPGDPPIGLLGAAREAVREEGWPAGRAEPAGFPGKDPQKRPRVVREGVGAALPQLQLFGGRGDRSALGEAHGGREKDPPRRLREERNLNFSCWRGKKKKSEMENDFIGHYP